jgi:hypothetical protein
MKITTTKSPEFSTDDVPLEWTLVDGQLHINDKPVLGSANSAGVRYLPTKYKINVAGRDYRYPLALIVYRMHNYRDFWPAFGVRYVDETLDPKHLNRAGNIVAASRKEAVEATDNVNASRSKKRKEWHEGLTEEEVRRRNSTNKDNAKRAFAGRSDANKHFIFKKFVQPKNEERWFGKQVGETPADIRELAEFCLNQKT